MSRYIHLPDPLRFPDERPMQLISRAAVTILDKPISAESITENPQAFAKVVMRSESFQSYQGSGYVLLSADIAGNWRAIFKSEKGTKIIAH